MKTPTELYKERETENLEKGICVYCEVPINQENGHYVTCKYSRSAKLQYMVKGGWGMRSRGGVWEVFFNTQTISAYCNRNTCEARLLEEYVKEANTPT